MIHLNQTVHRAGCRFARMKKTMLALTMILLAAGLAAAADSKTNVFAQEEGFVDAHGVLVYWKSIGRGAPLFVGSVRCV